MKNNLNIPDQARAFQDAVMAGRYERRNLHPVTIAAADAMGWSMLNLYDTESKETFGKHYRKAVKDYKASQSDHVDDIRALFN